MLHISLRDPKTAQAQAHLIQQLIGLLVILSVESIFYSGCHVVVKERPFDEEHVKVCDAYGRVATTFVPTADEYLQPVRRDVFCWILK